MGNDIDQYRRAIGCGGMPPTKTRCKLKNAWLFGCFGRMPVARGVMMTLVLVMLIRAGDVESNPGPNDEYQFVQPAQPHGLGPVTIQPTSPTATATTVHQTTTGNPVLDSFHFIFDITPNRGIHHKNNIKNNIKK